MRSASSYRGAKKRAARENGVPFGTYNRHYERSRHYAAAQVERAALNATPEAAKKALEVLGTDRLTPEQARRALSLWAAMGGRRSAISPAVADEELEALNAASPRNLSPEEKEAAVQAAKKITPEDIDAALEKALTRWQHVEHRVDPMPLSRLFAARARALGWTEGVEFYEEK